MKYFRFLPVIFALAFSISVTAAHAHGPYRGEWWLSSNWTASLVGPGYGFAGPAIGDATHYNVSLYWHTYYWVSRPKSERSNIHVSFPKRGPYKCIHLWNSRNNWEWEYCIDTSSPARASEAIASGVRNFILVTVGIAIPVWLAYTLAALMLPLAVI